MRVEKIPVDVLNACRELDRSDEEIERMTPQELFADYCQWEGLIGYSNRLWRVVTELSKGGRR